MPTPVSRATMLRTYHMTGAEPVVATSAPVVFRSGMMDAIRDAFAKANRANPSLFSFNSRGACQSCQGLGITYVDLAFLDPVKSVCGSAGGKIVFEGTPAELVKDEHGVTGKFLAERARTKPNQRTGNGR